MSIDLADPRHAQYVGWLLCAASVRTPGQESQTAIPCRKRPSRKPCRGHVQVMLTEVPELLCWRCPACGDQGVVDGWRNSIWNLRGWHDDDDIDLGSDLVLTLSAEEYRVVRESVHGPVVLIARAEPMHDGRVHMRGNLADVDDLLSALHELPAPFFHGRRGRILAAVRERLTDAKHRETGCEPPSFDPREVAHALAQNAQPDEHVRGLLASLAAHYDVPFEARLGRSKVLVDALTYVDGDPPELRAHTTHRGRRIEVNLGALEVDVETQPGFLAALYRSWWLHHDRRRRRG